MVASVVGALVMDGVYDLCSPSGAVSLALLDRGSPAALLAYIQGSIRDGAPVTGRASGNRTFSLDVVCKSTSRSALTALGNSVEKIVDQRTWTLSWTPLGGNTVNFTCFRATSVAITSTPIEEALTGRQRRTIVVQALPYGKSSAAVSLPLAGTSVVVDAYASGSRTVTPIANCSGLTASITGGALAVNLGSTASSPAIQFSAASTGLSVTAPSGGATTASVQYRLNTSGALAGSSLALTWGGVVHTFTQSATPSVSSGVWSTMTFPVSVPSGSTITAATLLIAVSGGTTGAVAFRAPFGGFEIDLDNLQLASATVTSVSDAQGGTYLVPGVPGTARTTCGLVLTQAGGASFGNWLVHRPPADKPVPPILVPFGGAAPGTGGVSVTVGGSGNINKYNGTYSVWLATAAISSPGSSRWVQVDAVQGGVTQSLRVIYPGAYAPGLIYMGEMVLPNRDYPDGAVSATTWTITAAINTDTFNAVLLLDVEGSSVISTAGASGGSTQVAVTEPTPPATFGDIWQGTSPQLALDASTLWAADTLLLDPGDNQLLIYCATGALQGTVSFTPSWQQEAAQ